MKKEPAAKKSNAARPAQKKPARMNGVATKKAMPSEFSRFLNPEFTRQLIEHMHRAKKAALKDQE